MVRPRFDPAREFVAMRGFTFHGEQIAAGAPVDKAKDTSRRFRMLYESRMIDFAPEGAMAAEDSSPVQMDGTPGGWYNITAPWLDEPERVRGKVNARRRRDAIREEGEPLDHHGVALAEGENGWWEVKAEWAEDPEKVHGEEDARARAAELRAEGPPAPAADPVTIEPGEGEHEGKFAVSAPWLDAPEVLDSNEAAIERADELREAGPPEGWEPPAAEPPETTEPATE